MGIILQNENTNDGIAAILTQIHQYVPQFTYTEEVCISDGTVEKIEKAKMHQILLGGDQLTAARARNSIKGKMNSQTPSKQLQGIIPVMEDWHTKANFLGVSCLCMNCIFIYMYCISFYS